MSFNIRYGTAQDGENRWERRAESVGEVIEDFAPHVLGIQEGLRFQMAALGARFPHLRRLGQHREGGTAGEFSGLLVDESRLCVEEWGELWLSPTPDEVASTGWDAALPRMAVWARLRDRVADSAPPFLVLGTHFDHRGARARLESAQLIVRRLEELVAEEHAPAVVLGDLNAGEDSPPLVAFRAAGYADTFRIAHPDATEVGTFNSFRGETSGPKIDHLLVTSGWHVVSASILRPRLPDGRCASDHDPVVAELRLR